MTTKRKRCFLLHRWKEVGVHGLWTLIDQCTKCGVCKATNVTTMSHTYFWKEES